MSDSLLLGVGVTVAVAVAVDPGGLFVGVGVGVLLRVGVGGKYIVDPSSINISECVDPCLLANFLTILLSPI